MHGHAGPAPCARARLDAAHAVFMHEHLHVRRPLVEHNRRNARAHHNLNTIVCGVVIVYKNTHAECFTYGCCCGPGGVAAIKGQQKNAPPAQPTPTRDPTRWTRGVGYGQAGLQPGIRIAELIRVTTSHVALAGSTTVGRRWGNTPKDDMRYHEAWAPVCVCTALLRPTF